MTKMGKMLLAGTAMCSVLPSVTAQAQTATLATGQLPAAPVAPWLIQSPSVAPVVPGRLQPHYRNIRPFYRNIRAFWGDVNPFYRNIRAFWGNVDPFYRNIRAFWGDIDPILNASAANAPAFGAIGPFWEEAGAKWDAISASWQTAGAYADNAAVYGTIAGQLDQLAGFSEATWGSAVSAKTGKSFRDGFATPMFTRFGIDPANPATLAALSAAEQSRFFVEWYDGLMDYAGVDHADHWMRTINWTPKLTQVQGSGEDAVIGLVDFFVAGDADIKSKVVYSGGESNFSTGHGAGVASLMVASHDGRGVMGIAPNASVAAYNPFDSTGTADWTSVRRGIVEVTKRNAAVVNLSLGMPNQVLSSEWRTVFKDPAVAGVKDRTIYVIAAGNDGIAPPGNIEFKDGFDSTFLVVGSVDPSGNISEFSNRPGTACLLDGGVCKDDPRKRVVDQLKESGLLMRRFLVAPGELILVSDDAGGITRQSGTSLSAPLVSGAIALIHDRWPWLKNHPRAVAAMILGSARDLGAPGIDPVYGVGLLDVEAAQSPLSFDALKYYLVTGTKSTEVKVNTLQDTGLNTTWETKDLFFSAFEDVNGAKRDFLIPLSSRLVGTTRSGEYFQDYVFDRMVTWINGGAGLAERPLRLGLAGNAAVPLARTGAGWAFGMNASLANPYGARIGRRARFRSTFVGESPSQSFDFAVGFGDGAVMLGSSGAFAARSDYDPLTGGVNPLLGFATGGSHVAAGARIATNVHLTVGYTANDADRDRPIREGTSETDRLLIEGIDPYRASAAQVRVDYQVGSRAQVSVSYTRLEEATGLLGVRSLEAADLAGGTATDGLTIGARFNLGAGFSLAGSATGSRSSTSSRAALSSADALIGTSYQLNVAKHRVFGRNDQLQLSIAQPLTIERGTIDFRTVQVIDRNTGEIGVVPQQIDVTSRNRRMILGAAYGLSMLQGQATISAFGRGELGTLEEDTPRFMLGGQAQLAF